MNFHLTFFLRFFFREDDQVVGALLTITEIKSHNYGRYLCRIEIGNAAHRLEMSATIFGTPIEAASHGSLISAVMLAFCVVLLVLVALILIQTIAKIVYAQQKRQKKLKEMFCNEDFRIRGV